VIYSSTGALQAFRILGDTNFLIVGLKKRY
jgi:hypothetical protein